MAWFCGNVQTRQEDEWLGSAAMFKHAKKRALSPALNTLALARRGCVFVWRKSVQDRATYSNNAQVRVRAQE
jgi:hypothetical protein